MRSVVAAGVVDCVRSHGGFWFRAVGESLDKSAVNRG